MREIVVHKRNLSPRYQDRLKRQIVDLCNASNSLLTWFQEQENPDLSEVAELVAEADGALRGLQEFLLYQIAFHRGRRALERKQIATRENGNRDGESDEGTGHNSHEYVRAIVEELEKMGALKDPRFRDPGSPDPRSRDQGNQDSLPR